MVTSQKYSTPSKESLEVRFYQTRVKGPEKQIEDLLIPHIPRLFNGLHYPIWVGGNLSVGAGRPDLIIAAYDDAVNRLNGLGREHLALIAFLKTIGWVRIQTISRKLGKQNEAISDLLNCLAELEIVEDKNGVFRLTSRWRNILPQVICIEAKVAKWKQAVEQAQRNLIFAHRSYIALPYDAAHKANRDIDSIDPRIGVLCIDNDGDVVVMRRGVVSPPKVWLYYYQIASSIAIQTKKVHCAI